MDLKNITKAKFSFGQLVTMLVMGFIVAVPIMLAILSARDLPSQSKAIRAGQQGLINPLIGYEISNNKNTFVEYMTLDKKLNENITKAKSEGRASQVSVYFRDLKTGRWTGIDEDAKYFPASLFKVPIMIAYLRQSENDLSILQRRLYYTGPGDSKEQDYSSPFNLLKPNQSYTIDELIKTMIVDSDNGAMNLLMDNANVQYLIDLFAELSIVTPAETTGSADQYGISAKMYSLFFRVLYSSTILNRDNSEKTLELLSKTTFKNGLNAGVPGDLTVAHKFGEHIGSPVGVEFHDCGIIYYPKNPYLLCVMTKGDSIDELTAVIANISKDVYQSVSTGKI